MKLITLVFCLLIVSIPAALAVDFSQPVSAADQATFDNILTPVLKIYNFVKYAATALAVLFLIFAGVTFIISGSDQAKREGAKTMGTSIVIGLVIIWIAPLVVQFLVQ